MSRLNAVLLIAALSVSAGLVGMTFGMQLAGYLDKQPRCDDKAPKLSKPVDRMRA